MAPFPWRPPDFLPFHGHPLQHPPGYAAQLGRPDYGMAAGFRGSPQGFQGPQGPQEEETPHARRNVKAVIEKMIGDYNIAPNVAWIMRSLTPDQQKLAAKIDPSGEADPSGYISEQLKKLV